jgi:hypothetical protein
VGKKSWGGKGGRTEGEKRKEGCLGRRKMGGNELVKKRLKEEG